jgi:hypothetical protein
VRFKLRDVCLYFLLDITAWVAFFVGETEHALPTEASSSVDDNSVRYVGKRTREERDADLRKSAVLVDDDDKSAVKKEACSSISEAAHTLSDSVAKIKNALDIDATISMPAAIKEANKLMDMEGKGGLPAQANALLKALGI